MIFTDGLGSPEGPVVLEDKSWLAVEMAPEKGCVTHISPDGKSKKIIAKTGRPNGLALDRDGIIWVAESQKPSLIKLTMDGHVEVLLTEYNGEPFLFPNDLAFGPDDFLYMTDSGILFEDFIIDGKLREDYKEDIYNGKVYRIDIRSGDIEKIDTGIKFTNGIAFGPDGNLYVNETITGMVYRYSLKEEGQVAKREDFGNVISQEEQEGFRGPDGMKFGADGNLYVTVWGQGDITVLGKDGEVVSRIKTEGMNPTNLAFGPKGEKKIYVTEGQFGTMEVIDVKTEGFPLF